MCIRKSFTLSAARQHLVVLDQVDAMAVDAVPVALGQNAVKEHAAADEAMKGALGVDELG